MKGKGSFLRNGAALFADHGSVIYTVANSKDSTDSDRSIQGDNSPKTAHVDTLRLSTYNPSNSEGKQTSLASVQVKGDSNEGETS